MNGSTTILSGCLGIWVTRIERVCTLVRRVMRVETVDRRKSARLEPLRGGRVAMWGLRWRVGHW